MVCVGNKFSLNSLIFLSNSCLRTSERRIRIESLLAWWYEIILYSIYVYWTSQAYFWRSVTPRLPIIATCWLASQDFITVSTAFKNMKNFITSDLGFTGLHNIFCSLLELSSISFFRKKNNNKTKNMKENLLNFYIWKVLTTLDRTRLSRGRG